MAKFWREMLKLMGAEQALRASHYPETDSPTEMLNQAVEQFQRCYMNHQQTGQIYCCMLYAEYAYVVHSSMGASPFKITQEFEGRILPGLKDMDQAPEGELKDWPAKLAQFQTLIEKELNQAKESTRNKLIKRTPIQWEMKPGDTLYSSTKNLKTGQW